MKTKFTNKWIKVNGELSVSGKLTISIPNMGVKEAMCSLTKTEFCYTIAARNFLSKETREAVSLKNVVCESKSTLGGERIFVLKRTDNRPVLKGYRTLEMSSTKEFADKWVHGFNSIGIFKDIKGSMGNLLGQELDSHNRRRTSTITAPKREQLRRQTTSEALGDPTTSDHRDILKRYIEEYMKVVDTTIRDITPKYIMLTLGKNDRKTFLDSCM